jgi:hypothetical protein
LQTFAHARALLTTAQTAAARTLLQHLITTFPAYDAPWLQLLALDPPLLEEIALLDGFLQHHPAHRVARACQSQLQNRQLMLLLQEGAGSPPAQPQTPPQALRIGEYLVQQQWVTQAQVDHALREQRHLREAGIEERLGTLLVMYGYLAPAQLAPALSATLVKGFGEFGDYLVRSGILSQAQVAEGLARQAVVRAELYQAYLSALSAYQRAGQRAPGRRWLDQAPEQPVWQPAPRLGEILVRMGLLTQTHVETLLEERERAFHVLFD